MKHYIRSPLGRLRRALPILFAFLAVAASPPDTATVHRIVAVGDLHGDFSAWRDIALAAGLEDASGKWAGGNTVFVQTGDVVDRGPDSRKIVQDLMRLQKEAPRAGGKVITLVGNHEAMNMTDDLRYVSAGDYAAFADANSAKLRDQAFAVNRAAIEASYHKKDPALGEDAIRKDWEATVPLGQIEHQAAWHPTGPIGQWVIGNPAAIMIDGTIFVHGGISAAYAKLSIAEINKRVARALATGDNKDNSILFADDGPLWYRGLARGIVEDEAPPGAYAAEPAPVISTEDELNEVLHTYKAKRMVIGHTPILSGIQIVHNGKLVRIDTGISAFYKGKVTYLEIIDGKLVPHEVARSAPSATGG